MSYFLQRVAQHLLQQNTPLKDFTLVLPSRRAALFLKKQLAKELSKPQFAPQITTIEDFVLESLDLKQEDQAILIFKLFEAYQASTIPAKDEFKEFLKWGTLLLADFNELDRYLIEPDDIFGYLSDVKRIESWNLKPGQHTEMLSNYLAFWEKLPEVHKLFSQNLLASKKVYQGLAYREVILQIKKVVALQKAASKKLFFIGFNALNKAEETLLLKLYEARLSEFLWDVDAYYFEDNLHEAGNFLRQSPLIKKLRSDENFNWLGNNLSVTKKTIEIIQAPGNNAQAVAANALISEIPIDEHKETALVLADEALLTPVLNNLNSAVEHLNITMGLPLQNSPLASFFDLLWQMLVKAELRGKAEYHHKEWEGLLTHPVFKRFTTDEQALPKVRQELVKQRIVYSSLQSLGLPKELQNLLFPVLGNMNTPVKGVEALGDVCLALKPFFTPKDQFIQALYSFYKLFNHLKALFESFTYINDYKTALQFYRQLVQSETLDLYGEPLKGLQLMGMLETRTLSFKRVILVSLNEDILPAGRSQNSLIPFDIKQKYGLPTYLEKDSIYAYHFYRLLQDSEHISLIYDNQSDGLGDGEASRFIAQLEYELPKVNPHVTIVRRMVQPNVSLHSQKQNIEKTKDVLIQLWRLAQTGFSPTTLSLYIKNPVEFYYQKVLGVKEPDLLADVIGYDIQGIVIHEILEDFYKHPKSQKPWAFIDEAQLDAAISNFNVEEAVVNKLLINNVTEFKSGKNLLVKEMLVSMLTHFFKAERDAIKSEKKIELIALEQKLNASFSFQNKTIHFKGIADRVERNLNGIVRIIDYKTGFVDLQKMHISSPEKLNEPDFGKAFQLCMYAYMYFLQNPNVHEISAGIVSLRKVHNWIIPLKWNKNTVLTRDFIPDFEQHLTEVFTELFDSTKPFTERKTM